MTALEKHPIKELTNEQDKTRLVVSLQKDNRQSVTFVQNGNEQKHFIEANPQFRENIIVQSKLLRTKARSKVMWVIAMRGQRHRTKEERSKTSHCHKYPVQIIGLLIH